MTITRRAFGVWVLSAVACRAAAAGPPDLVVDRTVCSHCGMLVSEPIYAAAFQLPGTDARLFDDIGCLVSAARTAPALEGARFWFHDAVSGAWIDGASAHFVAASSLRTPMGGGLVAYVDPAAAAEAATRLQGRVVRSVGDLIARPGGAS